MASRMIALLVAASAVAAAAGGELPPTCDRPVYCDSDLLKHVQLSAIYPDSKTFVDMKMTAPEDDVVARFKKLLDDTEDNPSKDQVIDFVNKFFAEGEELEPWTPSDLNPEPAFLAKIEDDTYRQFGRDINKIWPLLARKVGATVSENPDRYSLIPLPNGFVIPGGRFKEIYYWDSYWIIEGLLICDMKETARGMIENLLELLRTLGLVPNGSRVYYKGRSQPPLLTAMVKLYIDKTGDLEWLRSIIGVLETETQYWLEHQTVNVVLPRPRSTRSTQTGSSGGHFTLLRYNAPSKGPRPESYKEDYEWAHIFPNEEAQNEFYIDIKSAAESGWDFSSRWFIDDAGGNSGDLANVRTRDIIPVDLNAIFAGALNSLGHFHELLGNRLAAMKWRRMAARWRYAIDRVLWSQKDGVWFDYDLKNERHRKYFYPTNVAPLWPPASAVEKVLVKTKASRVVEYLKKSSGLKFPGGVPSSLLQTGEQWDFPNAWPPLESIVIGALNATGHPEANEIALHLANAWVRSNYVAFNRTQRMYEKYDVTQPGAAGGGGEYDVQDGFGWSNGVVLELLDKFSDGLKFSDEPDEDAPASESSENSSTGEVIQSKHRLISKFLN